MGDAAGALAGLFNVCLLTKRGSLDEAFGAGLALSADGSGAGRPGQQQHAGDKSSQYPTYIIYHFECGRKIRGSGVVEGYLYLKITMVI